MIKNVGLKLFFKDQKNKELRFMLLLKKHVTLPFIIIDK